MDSKFHELTKKFHDFDICKMTNKERYEFIWEVMLEKSCAKNPIVTNINLGDENIDQYDYLILPNNENLTPKERREILKSKFHIAIMYVNLNKHPGGGIDIYPIPVESYFGLNQDEFCKIGTGYFNASKFKVDKSIKDVLKNQIGIENEPYTDHWFLRDIPIDWIEFKPREYERKEVKKRWIFSTKKTVKETVYDISIKSKPAVQVGVLKGINNDTGETFMKMIPKWNFESFTDTNPNWNNFRKNVVYLNMLKMLPPMNGYIVVGGWEYNVVDWDNGCVCMQPYLCHITPLYIEEVAIKTSN